MAGAYETAATAVKQIIDTEFSTEGFVAVHDKLHPSLGTSATAIGISPEGWRPNPRNRLMKETLILVQFYDKWNKEINPAQRVNPARITVFAERFEDAVRQQQATDPGSGDVWYFDVDSVETPDDPTGNKTRFEARIRVRGGNNALIETGP